MKRGIDFIGVGVGAVICDADKQVLLLLRRKPPEAGFWSIPGGAVEFGEPIEVALLRELKEEIAVDGKIITLLQVTNHIGENGAYHWVSPAFLVEIINGTPAIQEPASHEDLRWFALGSLPDNITLTTSCALQAYQQTKAP